MNDPFSKPYNPNEHETRIYQKWESSGFFNPDVAIKAGITDPQAPVFSIVLPPPNVTGTLHLGHAAMLAIEDIVVRTKRMQGYRTLWIPGTDHAAIATQSRVEKDMSKEGLRKHDMSRADFLARVNKFALESHDTIVTQVKGMGASLDWSREAFTLDAPRERAVRTAFKKMYDDGLIYRKYRVVNWDPKGQTTISDDEIIYEERQAEMYTFRYSPDFPIAIATTRPETKVGDVAVAVHPDDTRYTAYIGKTYDINFAGVPLSIKVVADTDVDMTFGTGAVGITPAHSQTDWIIGERHGLPVIPVIDEYGKMTVGDETIKGKKTVEARAAIVAWLTTNNLIEKTETITQNVSTAERTGAIIEPLPKLQWFINVTKPFTLAYSKITGIPSGSSTTLKDMMRAVVENNQTTIIPDRFQAIYFHWINNLKDWCISRQIWYGHQIPVWYRKSDGVADNEGAQNEEIYVGVTAPIDDEKGAWTQDADTLDTWFSSGLWTFSTLGWPDKTDDLITYHPTTLLETGYDIIFFWVARMILMSGYLLGETPFTTVYLHGLVRDAKGRKMSKSLGNGLDPLEMITKYGADAVRMSLIVGTGPGNDSKMSEDKIRAYKNFANKIWNATRFVMFSNTDYDPLHPPVEAALDADDLESLQEMRRTIADITAEIEAYHLYLGAEKIYHYFWHTFADVVIERCKIKIMKANDAAAAHTAGTEGATAATPDMIQSKRSAQYTLHTILTTSLKVLHPFMPFVTETIWEKLQKENDQHLLMTETWPS